MCKAMGRPPYEETPEAKALRRRVLALRRRRKPTIARMDKHAWVKELLSLIESRAWEVMQPQESYRQFLKALYLNNQRIYEYRIYMGVYEAAVEAGINHYHLRFMPIRNIYNLHPLKNQPNKLIEAILGPKAMEERKRKVHNAATRKRGRPRKLPSPSGDS